MNQYNELIFFFESNRYTADDDGYHADVSYLIDKNALNHPNEGFVNDVPEQRLQSLHFHKSFYDVNSFRIPTSNPKAPDKYYFLDEFERRKSISAQPTYVVTERRTLSQALRIVPTNDGLYF